MTRPEPLIGCLVCHQEGTIELVSPSQRVLNIGDNYPRLICQSCQSVAIFDGDEDDGDIQWRIRYKTVGDSSVTYDYAKRKLKPSLWHQDDDALELSRDIYTQRYRIQQLQNKDFEWLRPETLNPPPPLMRPDETVYLTLKSVSYCEEQPTQLGLFKKAPEILDTGICYITDSKVHLLGQRRDRSHKLSEIQAEYKDDIWYARIADNSLYYTGFSQSKLDAEVIVTIFKVLSGLTGTEDN